MTRIRWTSVSALALIALFCAALATRVFAFMGQQQAAASAPGQAAAAQAKGDQPAEQPEDVKALNDALKMVDNARRFPALQKVIDDYPKSEAAAVARAQLGSQLASSLMADKNALQSYLTKDLADAKNPQDFSQIASALVRADAYLDQAEAAATKGLAIDEQTYVAAMKEARAATTKPLARTMKDGVPYYSTGTTAGGRGGRGQRDLTDDDLREQFKTNRFTLMNTLGTIYVKRGKTAEAEKTLKEAWAGDMPPTWRGNLASTLADLAAKTGNTRDELDYRACAYVHGRASAANRQALETVYSKVHGGSLDGLEAMLDEKYRQWARPLDATAYTRPAATNPRMVLAELFTGAACPPCVGADMAFDAALERYARNDLAFIVYHQHIPGPDPMTNPATEARKGIYALRGVPTFAIDGTSKVGGGGADAAEGIFKEDIAPVVEKAMAEPPEATIRLNASVVGATVKVDATVSSIRSKSPKLKLQIALVEEQQRYSGPNGMRFHPMVVRSLAGPEFKGFPITAKGGKIEHVFDVAKIVADNRKATEEFLGKPFRGGDKPTFTDGRREAIDRTRLLVVAFVQDEDTAQDPPKSTADGDAAPRGGEGPPPVRHVLQAAMIRVPAPGKRTTN